MIDFVPAAIGKKPDWISDISISSAGKNVTVFLTMAQRQQLQMSLVMMTGRSIPVHVSNSFMQGRNEIDLMLPDYPPGIYLLRIEDMMGNSISKKFIY